MRFAPPAGHTLFTPLALAIHLSLGGLLASASLPSLAAQQNQRYDIPAGPLGESLNLFARQAGVAISFDAAQVRGLSSPGLQGNVDTATGFARLLGASPLQVVAVADGYLLMARTTQQGAVELGETQVTGTRFESLAVTEGSGSYTPRAVTIGKGEHSLKETPQSVTVITRKQMDDQNLTTIEQVMEKTPGVTLVSSPMGGQYFYSRGFRMDAPYQYDGVPLDLGNNYVQADSFSAEMTVFDHVEVLRGAAGMMKGAGTPAGAVNLVRKRGQATPAASITLSGGSWDNYRQQVDVGGPLNDSGTLRGRAVIANQSRQYFYDVAKRDDQTAYAALDYDLTPDTTVGMGVSYEKLDATPCFGGLPRYSDGSALKVSRSTCLGQSWNDWDSERTTVFADVRHSFNDDWALKLASVYSHNDQNIKYGWGAGGGSVTPGSSTSALTTRAGLFDYDQTDYGLDGYLNGKFEAFGREHELTIGANVSRSKSHDLWALMAFTSTTNVFNPDHSVVQPGDATIVSRQYLGGWPTPSISETRQEGVYANLRYKLAEPLTLVLGGRVSWYEYDAYNRSYFGSVSQTHKRESGQFTPFGALLFDLTPNLTAYASYADIFQPQSNIDREGKVLQPKTGKNYELGIKGEWYNGALNGSFNLFRAYQEHAAAAIANRADCQTASNCSVDSGKVRAQGYELEVSGSPLPRLQVMAGYTYTQTRTLSPVSSTSGASGDGSIYNSLVPRHLLRAWSDYQLPGSLKDWSLGGGVTVQSGVYSVSDNIKSEQAGYALWSARVQYRLDEHWSVALNGNNLFDKKYYQTVGNIEAGNYYGAPRNYMLTVKADF